MGKTYDLAAPTGRAAKRMQELTGQNAKTIHRLLEWSPVENSFQKNETNPLTSQVCIVDEASMIDTFLASHLFKAISPGCQIILIGDVDQLPSIGPGNILRDLIDSNMIASKKLTEIFRQAAKSVIVKTSHRINQGETSEFENSDTCDCHFLEADSPEGILDMTESLLRQHLPAAGYNVDTDVQIITPMTKGIVGSLNINRFVKKILNPRAKENLKSEDQIETGDKVIQIVNNYELSVFNGDIGSVSASRVNDNQTMVRFGDREVSYSSDHSGNLQLAYAITIHKSQGSEFKVVIIPLTMHHRVMLQRNLIYTALTRAKTLAIFIGSKKALNYAVSNNISSSRQTLLKDRLRLYPSDLDRVSDMKQLEGSIDLA